MRSWISRLIVVLGAYVLAGKAGLSVAFVHANASAVWPPTGIALAALLILGYRAWPAIFVGAFVVNITTAGSVATSLGIATGNTLEGLIGAYLINRFANGIGTFDRAQDVFKFAGLAALSTTVSATVGVTSLLLGGSAEWASLDDIWLTWWLGDAAGALIFCPLLVLWIRDRRLDLFTRHPREAACLFLSTIVVGLAVFCDGLALLGLRTLSLTFLCVPPLLWAAFRFRQREAATLVAVLSGIAIWETLHSSGPFASVTANESLLLLQAFMGTVSVMILSAAALVEERRRVEQDREELLVREQAARAEAEGANRAKDEFLAMLGHELRNPLAAIISAVSVLDRIGNQDEVSAKARGAIRYQITHLSRLVDDLLDVAHVTRGEIELACQPLDLAASVQRCVSMLAGTGRLERHLIDVQAEPLWVNADPTRVDQIVANLLTNATKYTPPGGSIRVSVKRESGEAVVRVKDTGIGIPAGLLPRVFDLFAQSGYRPDRVQGGLGVGLSLVQQLVLLHGGRVEASSDGPGRGSEFVVRLPRVEPPPASPEPVVAPGAAPQRRRVLIIEDNADAREMLRLALELAGHAVEVAENGYQALDLAATRCPEVVLVDIGLPGLDGYEVARRLRATSRGSEMRLLAVTGYGQSRDRHGSPEPGFDAYLFDAYLVKPVDPEELVGMIAKAGSYSGAESRT